MLEDFDEGDIFISHLNLNVHQEHFSSGFFLVSIRPFTYPF